ncbi:polysaccharide lyase family 4 protein [Dothistroma septosporum NZE10]|uniref:Polysaccharide lyase family 4 protein n=1 Tax=Dothistroma septosporum (strain NZE10 / CBS 128990) TaxID=675120 RepID=N1PC11_DOTSN|nr:polysaccharide lyase family 4 protein [Dothistroma septosporum NZE10]
MDLPLLMGETFGAWFVMNTIDTYNGGPTHSDLTVDGILYNYMVSNHHGDQVPNITDGFERTYGPGYYHFNKGAAGGSLGDSRQDALQYADPEWNSEFYDSIAKVVLGYVPSSGRGVWRGKVEVAKGCGDTCGDFDRKWRNWQDNVLEPGTYQYWADVDAETGEVYADRVFGQLEVDDVVVSAGKTTITEVKWAKESAGVELWRTGTPGKSSGEYRHGSQPDPDHPLHPEEYRIYWAVHDLVDDFPEGVTFKVGKGNMTRDLNYVHWSVFGGYANSIRTEAYYGNGNVNNWTVLFEVSQSQIRKRSQATLTVQLAGAKTAAGHTGALNVTQPCSNLPCVVNINGDNLEPWTIP